MAPLPLVNGLSQRISQTVIMARLAAPVAMGLGNGFAPARRGAAQSCVLPVFWIAAAPGEMPHSLQAGAALRACHAPATS